MQLKDAKQGLEELIEDAGVDPLHPDALLIWRVFCDFTRLSFDAPVNGLAFLAGVRAASDGDTFQIELRRQFARVPFTTPQWDRSQQNSSYSVSVELCYDPAESLIQFVEQHFSSHFRSERDFLRHMEELELFRTAFYSLRPSSHKIMVRGTPF